MSAPRSGLVAVLFTDLVGSTELMSQLGDRAFDDLRRRHFAALGKAVAAHGGEEVKNTGDGLMAVFPSAAEAVEAAVAMQQATARQSRSHPLAIRVGISVGDATFEGGDYFGTPVVEAARLVTAARPGQILTTQIARALAGSRCAATFTDLGPLALKGLPEPLPVSEVGWESTGSTVPMPALLTDVGRIFVGRDAELERLNQLWKEAAAGERRVALLSGEPGVGKTRLAAELAAVVHEEGATVLAGRCDEDLGVPYQPFVEALRHFVDHTPPEDLLPRLGRYGGELTRLVPELAESLPDLPAPLRSDPETERYRLFDAVAGWLAAASSDEPVLVILDDLQWAAKPTLLLLRHVVRAGGGRVLVVGTYRDTELAHDHPLVDVVTDLRRQGGVERLSLSGLDGVAVTALVEQAAGRALDATGLALARAVYEETEGNPFFVREILRHLAETGAVERRGEGWTTRLPVDELGIPEGVREAVGHRLSRLSNDTNHALRIAAVVGAEFELDVVQSAADLSQETVLGAVEEAAAARLIVEVSATRFRFAHALVRDTLYESLTAPRKVALHRKAAEAIEKVYDTALDDYVPALAYHWAKASSPPTDINKAVNYAARAGDRALAQLAHDEAAAYYRQALELLDAASPPGDKTRRGELLILLGEAQRRAGDPAHRDTLLHAARLARERGDAAALARAVLANTRGHLPTRIGTVDTEKVEMLEAAIAAVGDGDQRARANLLAVLAMELTFSGQWRRCLALTKEALGLARSVGEPAALAQVLVATLYPTYVPDLLEERLANTAELMRAVESLGDPALTVGAQLLRGRTAMEAGDIPQADACLAAADRLSVGLGQPALRWRVCIILIGQAVVTARFEDAERLLDEYRTLGHQTGQAEAEWAYGLQKLCLRYSEGRLDDDVVHLLEAGARTIDVPWNQSMLALAWCETNRDGQAQAALEDFASTSVPFDLYWLPTTCNWAIVAARLGNVPAAGRLEPALRPYAKQVIPFAPWPSPSVAHHLALLNTTVGRFDEAEGDFTQAARTHDHIGARHWLARTRLEWARMLLTRRQPDDVERARELLRQALATARELGLANVQRRTVELLQ